MMRSICEWSVFCGGSLVVLWWFCGGSMVVLLWFCGGSVVDLVL